MRKNCKNNVVENFNNINANPINRYIAHYIKQHIELIFTLIYFILFNINILNISTFIYLNMQLLNII